MRKFIAIVLLIFPFLPLACGALSLLAVNSWILDRGFYTGVADDPRLYEALLDEDLPAFLMRETASSGEEFPAAALAAGLQTVVTSDYLRTEAVGFVTDFFDYIDGKTNTLNAAIDLTPVKAILASPDGRTSFSRAVADNLLPCASGQSAFPSNSKLPVCRPAGETADSMFEQIHKALPGIVETLPDTLPFTSASSSDLEIRDGFSALRWGLNSGVSGLAFAAAVFGILLAVIGGDGLNGKLRWAGVALLIPSLMILGLGLAINQGGSLNWLNSANSEFRINGELVSSEFSGTALAIFENVFQRVGGSFATTGFLAGAVSLILIFVGFLLPSVPASQRGGSGGWVEVPVGGPFVDVPGKPKRKEKPIYDGDDSLVSDDSYDRYDDDLIS
jgi:hypothetical protein